MNVLELCTDFPPGGIQRHVIDLGAWLTEKGHNVYFGGAAGAWMNGDINPDFLSLNLVAVSADGRSMFNRLRHVLTCIWKLRAFLIRHRIALVHAHESAPALIARLATLGLSIPVVVTYHGSEPERVGQFGLIARTLDRVVAVSRRSGADLVERGGVPAEKLRIIGLGVRPRPEPDANAVGALRQDLLGAQGRVLIVTLARLAHQKGIDILIEVVRRAISERPDLRFVVVGGGPQANVVQGWAETAGVADHIRFVGQSETPELYLKAADIFLLTSRWEALPFSIAEAFQMGVPTLATDCGGVAELIDEAVGLVLPVGDVVAITEAVLAVAADAAGRKTMAANALARSREDRFVPNHIHRQIEQLYCEMAAPA